MIVIRGEIELAGTASDVRPRRLGPADDVQARGPSGQHSSTVK